MPLLGLDVSKKHIDELFDSFDSDGGGSIGYEELKQILGRGSAPPPASKFRVFQILCSRYLRIDSRRHAAASASYLAQTNASCPKLLMQRTAAMLSEATYHFQGARSASVSVRMRMRVRCVCGMKN